MLFLRQAEGKDVALVEQRLGFCLQRLVVAHPDRSYAQHRHLVGVPVAQAEEAEHLGKAADAPAVPDRVLAGLAVAGWRHHRRQDAFTLAELQKVGVPDRAVVVFLESGQPLGLKESHRFFHDLARTLIRVVANQMPGVEQKHGRLRRWVNQHCRSDTAPQACSAVCHDTRSRIGALRLKSASHAAINSRTASKLSFISVWATFKS